MDERYPKSRRVDDGQGPSGLSVAQQQQQIAGYPIAGYPAQQYQNPAQAHWYGSGAQSTNAPLPQPPQPPSGYSSTSAGPSYSQYAHLAHAPTRNPSMYAAPISTAPSRWTSGSSSQGQEQGQEQFYHSGATAYSQPMHAYQQPPYTFHTPAGSSSSGSGSIARPTPPMAFGPIPPSATVPLVTRPLSSSAGSNSQLSPSAISRDDTYESVLGNAFNPVAPTGLAPQALPTLDFPCLAPPLSLPARIDPLASASQSALPSDPLQPISPPRRPACSKRVSKRKRMRSVSREEDPDPRITSQLQAAGHGLPSSTTTATPRSPRIIRGFVGRDGSSGRMAPPSVPSRQPGHHQRSSLTSSGIHQQQSQPGNPTVPVGSMDEHHSKRRRVDDGQSPSGRRVAQQRQQIAECPTQQYQTQAHTQWHGSGAQPTNAPMSQPSQPPYGFAPTATGTSDSQHARITNLPARNTSIYAAAIPTAPSQETSGSSTQSKEQYPYHSVPVAYPQLMQMQPSQQPPHISPTPATLAKTVSLADNPSSDVPPYLAQANLTASTETPNSGAVPGGSNASVGSTTAMGEPTSLNQRVGPIRSNRNNSRQVSNPYQRPTPTGRKTQPITYEGNLVRLQQRCRRQGADEGAIELLGKVFTHEVSLEALTRPLTDGEVETKEFGIETGRVYITFLGAINEEGYACRLCHSEKIWRHHKDVVRHLRRDHFGFADVCNQCDKKFYTKGEMTRHPCR